MKKTVILALAAAILFSASAPAVFSPPGTSAEAMIVLHAGSGAVLAEKNADTPMLIASTTKLMTALTALDLASPERSVTVQSEWTTVEGSSMYLRAGESYTLRELLEGLLLASGNDAALAIAGSLGGDAFIEQMNRKAEELGLTASHFANPHGLDADGHRASAHDLGLIMAAALQNDVLAEILSMRSSCIHGVTYVNHNKLLWRCEGCIGGKTGYTLAAGRCLVSCCERDGTRLICVTLSAPDDWNDHCRLYDWAFSQYSDRRALSDGSLPEVPVTSGTESAAAVRPSEELSLFLPRDAELTVRYELPRFVFAPVNMGENAGRYEIEYNGEVIADGELVYAADVPRIRKTYSYLHLRLELA